LKKSLSQKTKGGIKKEGGRKSAKQAGGKKGGLNYKRGEGIAPVWTIPKKPRR